jgi:hypothetical protein
MNNSMKLDNVLQNVIARLINLKARNDFELKTILYVKINVKIVTF